MNAARQLNLKLKNLLLTGLVGWITALYTLWHRAKVQAGVELGESFCNLNEAINCDTVALSPYSSFAGVSVPTMGLIYFTIVILLAMRALKQHRQNSVGEQTRKLILLTASVGVLTSIVLAILSLTQIGAFCLVCGIIYFLCVLNFFFSWTLYKFAAKKEESPERFSKATLFLFVAALAAQFLFEPMANFAARQSGAGDSSEIAPEILQQVVAQMNAQNRYDIPDQSSPVFGNPQAKVTLVEFSDFECPHCANNHKHMRELLNAMGSEIRVVYKNFPLDPACNTGGSHRLACHAARVARCVFKLGGKDPFQKIQHILFEEQKSFTKESMKKSALAFGIKEPDLTSCLESSQVQEEIREEIEVAKSVGVEGTPSLFVNGKLLKMGTNAPLVRAVIKDLLKP